MEKIARKKHFRHNWSVRFFAKIFVGLFLLSANLNFVAAAGISIPTANSVENNDQSFFKTWREISAQKNQIAELEIDLEFLTEKFRNTAAQTLKENEEKFDELKTRLEILRDEIASEQSSPTVGENVLQMWQSEKEGLSEELQKTQNEIENLKLATKNEEKLRNEKITTARAEIANLTSEIEKNGEIARRQFWQLTQRILFYAAFIFVAIIFHGFVKRAIRKYGKNLPAKRQEILIRLSNTFVFSVVGIVVGSILFAQFAVILPFLALLGTGLAFAVRDVIS